MKTLTDRKIAQEEEKTFEIQRMTQEKRQGVEKETAIADMQREIVKAQQSVEISQRTADASVKKAEGDATSLKLKVNAEAEATRMRAQADAEATRLTAGAEAERISKTGLAEAEKIMAVGKSTAEAYELQVKAMGGDNFTRFKVTEEIGKSGIKVIPDVLIGGNGTEGGVSGLLGLKLMEMIGEKAKN